MAEVNSLPGTAGLGGTQPPGPVPARGLTARQARFVEEYLKDLNASAAARRAGYSARTGDRHAHELLKKPEIQDAIRSAQAERAERTKLTQDAVIAGLRAEAERLGEGGSASARVAAWKLLGQHLGMFAERPLLEVLIASLPPELAGPLRESLARQVLAGRGEAGGHAGP